jgi:hypothetical protein
MIDSILDENPDQNQDRDHVLLVNGNLLLISNNWGDGSRALVIRNKALLINKIIMGKEFVSSIKPDSIPGKKRPEPKIEWNNRTYESYIKHGLTFEEFSPPLSTNKRETFCN